MRLLTALKILQNAGVPVIETRDAAYKLGLTNESASRALKRLASDNHIIHLSRGLWAIDKQINSLLLPEYLLAPFPCYISLQTALYHHGMIDQIPRIITAVSPARTRRIRTPLAIISNHRLVPEFFFGYEVDPKTQVKMATPEKALLDIFYLKPAKSLWFKSLPEVEIPTSFDPKKAFEMIRKIPSQARRTMVEASLRSVLKPTRRQIDDSGSV